MRHHLVVPALMLALLAGCSSTPMSGDQSGASVEDRSSGTVQTPGVQTVTPGQSGGDAGIAAVKDPNNILSTRSVLFDYDSFTIRDEFKPLIQAHARFLQTNPKMKMLVQGNTDDRGSREYNIALGQKRADAVKKALQLLGAADAQIESVSLGEEKPRCLDASEACWAENRRGDMLYSGEF